MSSPKLVETNSFKCHQCMVIGNRHLDVDVARLQRAQTRMEREALRKLNTQAEHRDGVSIAQDPMQHNRNALKAQHRAVRMLTLRLMD